MDKNLKKNIKHSLIRGIAFGLLTFLKLFPRSVRLKIASFIGYIIFLFNKREKTLIKKNLTYIFGKNFDKKIPQRCFSFYCECLCDMFTLPRQKIRKIFAKWDHSLIAELIEKYKGVILVTGHIGNWELMAANFISYGYRLITFARRLRSPLLNKVIEKRRRYFGIEIIYHDEEIKKVFKALKNHIAIGILPDQNIKRVEGVYVDFLGKPAYTPIGPVIIGYLAKVPLLPAYCIKHNKNYKIILGEPVFIKENVRKDKEALLCYTKKLYELLEQLIIKYPHQWVWLHDRWGIENK